MKNRKNSKVIKIGGSLAVTLPESIVRENGIKQGDMVVPVGKSLIVLSLEKVG